MDDGIALIIFARKSRQIEGAISAVTGKAGWSLIIRWGHGKDVRAGSRRLLPERNKKPALGNQERVNEN